MAGIEPHHYIADERYDKCPVHIGIVSYQSHEYRTYGTAHRRHHQEGRGTLRMAAQPFQRESKMVGNIMASKA